MILFESIDRIYLDNLLKITHYNETMMPCPFGHAQVIVINKQIIQLGHTAGD